MSKKLIATTSLVFALATAAGASDAMAGPPSGWPSSPGVCNMLHVEDSAVGLAGMANSWHGQGFDNMMALTDANGCWG